MNYVFSHEVDNEFKRFVIDNYLNWKSSHLSSSYGSPFKFYTHLGTFHESEILSWMTKLHKLFYL